MRSDRSASLLALETSFIEGAFRLMGISPSYAAAVGLVHLSRDTMARSPELERDEGSGRVYNAAKPAI
jgi:hypothetical protein